MIPEKFEDTKEIIRKKIIDRMRLVFCKIRFIPS